MTVNYMRQVSMKSIGHQNLSTDHVNRLKSSNHVKETMLYTWWNYKTFIYCELLSLAATKL